MWRLSRTVGSSGLMRLSLRGVSVDVAAAVAPSPRHLAPTRVCWRGPVRTSKRGFVSPRRPAPKRRVVRKKRTSAVTSAAAAAPPPPPPHAVGSEAAGGTNQPNQPMPSPANELADEEDVVVVEYPFSPRLPSRVSAFKPHCSSSVAAAVRAPQQGHHTQPTDTLSSAAPSPLPPWPVDAVEFNARARYGGHDVRLRAARTQTRPLAGTAPGEAPTARDQGTHATTQPPLRTPPALSMPAEAQRARLDEVQQTPAGQAALAAGGWVCSGCFVPIPLASRSVCSQCFHVRHDLAFRPSVAQGRSDAQSWRCRVCDEFNSARDLVCRCCGTPKTEPVADESGIPRETGARSSGGALRRVERRTVADELQHTPLGSVLDVRSRVLRWRCVGCTSVNSLQARLCRHCRAERFAVALRCDGCLNITRLNNAKMYGETAEAAADPARLFHLDNRFAPFAPQLCCTHCHQTLHGASVLTPDTLSDAAHLWWCACGMTNKTMRHSCMRCRLPRLVPPMIRRELMPFLFTGTAPREARDRHSGGGSGVPGVRGERGIEGGWDFKDCTHWYCQSCDGINKASRYVVYAMQSSTPPRSSATQDGCNADRSHTTPNEKRVARMFHGNVRCQHCHAPWHHLILPDGAYWRCACLQVNSTTTPSTSPPSHARPPTMAEGAIATTTTVTATAATDTHDEHTRADESSVGAPCICCGLPPLDSIRPDTLSTWTPGDWYCTRCGRHCYRERMTCLCGATRPGALSATQSHAESTA